MEAEEEEEPHMEGEESHMEVEFLLTRSHACAHLGESLTLCRRSQ